MSAPAMFASSEVAHHRMQDHFPCRGEDDAIVLYVCPCEVATLHVCEACGECLAVSLEDRRTCEHSDALYAATDQMRRAARVADGEVWVAAEIGMHA